MHRIMLADGSYRQSAFLRWMRTTAYLLLGLSGLLLLLSPVWTVQEDLFAEVMLWFLMIGGGCSAGGALFKRWVGEFVGLPLLASAFAVLAIMTWWNGHAATPYIASANGVLLLAYSALMLSRWRVVLAVFHFADSLSRRKDLHLGGGDSA